ncbi:hypothetical protein [Brevundimonas denitrificans]|nr:hypothetical protein [Brevundimonas denitrificans]
MSDTDWGGHQYVELAAEIALMKEPEARLVALEAAAIRLIQDGHDPLDDLLAKVTRARHEGLAADHLGIPLAAQTRTQLRWKVVGGNLEVVS